MSGRRKVATRAKSDTRALKRAYRRRGKSQGLRSFAVNTAQGSGRLAEAAQGWLARKAVR